MTDTERPTAPIQTETFRISRPDIVGPESPEPPFPIYMSGVVQKGFGRGGKDLGCPTANLPDEEALESIKSAAKTGIYFGYARVHATVVETGELGDVKGEELETYPMVMSLGWNPFYKNEKLTAEVHIIHEFSADFYGQRISIVILGYIRPELDYTSRDALIQDIDKDKEVALTSLARPAYRAYEKHCPSKAPSPSVYESSQAYIPGTADIYHLRKPLPFMLDPADACPTGECPQSDPIKIAETVTDTQKKEDVTVPVMFDPPPFAAVPGITIEFCDRCRWLHRATWVQTELFLTFPSPTIESITLIPLRAPETSGRFRVWLYWKQAVGGGAVTETSSNTVAEGKSMTPNNVAEELLWDRKTEGGFPELKILKQKIRDRLTPGLSLGHSDKKSES
ncbi:riboflavin kinase [Tulasnella sp. JGI-2019a]|nr:riboflavin kinase [Tulasnella sp. JGI-2019a]